MDSLENKINNITTLTSSQADRLELQLQVQENLIKFINAQIQSVSEQKSLYSVAIQAAKDKLQQDIDDEVLSWPVILKIIDSVGKLTNEKIIGLFDIVKSNNQKNNNDKTINPTDNTPQEKLPEISNEQMTVMKDFLDMMKSVKNSEFSKKEK
jgi:hypothetical protein